MKNPLVGYLLTFIAGAIVAGIFYSPEPEVKVITETERVVEVKTEVKRVEVTKAPEECTKLGERSLAAIEDAGVIQGSASGMLDIMSKLRIAVASGDSNTVNELETKVRKLNSTTLRSVERLGNTIDPLEAQAIACENGAK